MRNFFITAFFLACTAASQAQTTDRLEKAVKVDITQLVAHPALDATRKGVEDYLAEAGYKVGKNLKINFQSAQGSITTATQIARQFAGEKPDVIVAISTPSAQTMAAATKTTPIVFATVTDPIEAKLVASLERPGGNITGVSDRSDVAANLALLKEIKPDLKKLGYLYNASEANSVSTLKTLRALAKPYEIEIIPSAAPKSADVQAATRALIGKVDIIYVPTDNTVIAVLEGAVQVGNETKTPIFTADATSINRGAFAAQGTDYYQHGRQVGALVVRILKGEKPDTLAVTTGDNDKISLNLREARLIGLTIPQSVINKAARVLP